MVKSTAASPTTFNLAINNATGGAGNKPVFTDSQIHIVAYGVDPATDKQCFIAFENSGIGTLKPVASQDTKSPDYTYPLSYFTAASLTIPNINSGRLYISIADRPGEVLTLDIKSDLSINAPSFSDPSDPNFFRLYDKLEFTLDDHDQLYINPTAVDFFAIPITIALGGNTSGIDTSRELAITGIGSVLNDPDVDPVWGNLFVYYPDNASQDRILVRIASPKIKLADHFNQDYLADYLKQFWAYYSDPANTLSVDCSEVYTLTADWTDPATGNVYKNGAGIPQGVVIYEDGQVAKGDLVFQLKGFTSPAPSLTPNPESTVSIKEPNSFDFFSGDGGNWQITNGMPDGIIMREIGSAFTVGLLPPQPIAVNKVKNVVTLSKNYFEAAKSDNGGDSGNTLGIFFAPGNPQLPNVPKSGAGFPWHNQYSKAIHSLGFPCYAYAFSDALCMDGTLQASSVKPATATVTINDMTGTKIPAIDTDDRIYTVTFQMPARKVEVKCGDNIQYNGTTAILKPPYKISVNGVSVSVNLNTRTTSPAHIGVTIKDLVRDASKGTFTLAFGPNTPPLYPIPANPEWTFSKITNMTLDDMTPKEYDGVYSFSFDGVSKCSLTWTADKTTPGGLPTTPSGIIMPCVVCSAPTIVAKSCTWNVTGFSLDKQGNWTTGLTIQFGDKTQTNSQQIVIDSQVSGST